MYGVGADFGGGMVGAGGGLDKRSSEDGANLSQQLGKEVSEKKYP